MSIFDLTPGERPAAGATPPVVQQQVSMAAGVSSLRDGIGLRLGERPAPLCPPTIVWPDALTGEAEKILSDLPCARPPLVVVRPAEQALAEIDAALRRNNARVTINGLFDLDDHQWDDR